MTGGTRVLSDRIVVEITATAGKSFLDRMIALVEGAIRQRTPNEIALSLVLAAFTLIFLIVTAALWPMALNAEIYMTGLCQQSEPLHSLGTDVPTLVALLVCLIPTTIGALLAAIGIAGMDRALRANILAKSGKAVEVAGDVDTLLLDKTGTITIGNRQATQFVPMDGFSAEQLGELAALASFADQTPEGRASSNCIVSSRGGGRQSRGATARLAETIPADARFIAFTAQTRMSGIDLPGPARFARGARTRSSPTSLRRRQSARSVQRTSRRRRLARSDAAVGVRRKSDRRHGRAGRYFEARTFAIASNGCGGWACER